MVPVLRPHQSQRHPREGTGPEELKREIGLPTATFVVIASMIGTGIFTTSGFIVQALHDPWWMLLCWGLGGVFALSGALCYGELGAMFPRAGGDYVFLREGFGKPMGFLSGWISLIVGFSAPIAAAAIGSASYLFRALPNDLVPHPMTLLLPIAPLHISPVTLFAVMAILFFSLAHIYSLAFGGNIQNLLTLFKIGVILFFVLGGFAFGKGTVDHFPAFPGVGPLLSGGFASSLVFVIYAYSGWNAAAYMGGEIREPSRNIPLALVIGTSVVIILYLLLNLLFVYALPIGRMSGVIEVGAEAALALFGPAMGKFFSAMVMFCLLSMISAMVMTGPRIYYAMARDRIFFNSFGRVRGTSGTPAASILLQGAIAIAMVLTSTFDALLLYVGFTLSLFSMFTVVGMMRLRRRRPEAHRPYKTYGYPLTPLLFILGNLWIIAFFIKENPVISLYGAGTIVSGIIVYLCFHRYYGTDRNRNGGGSLS